MFWISRCLKWHYSVIDMTSMPAGRRNNAARLVSLATPEAR